MAFGDSIQKSTPTSGNGTDITSAFVSAPTEGNLMVMWAMTGDGTLNAPSGWSTGVAVNNATEADSCAIFYKIAGAGEATSHTATSGASDEYAVLMEEIEGPWEVAPLDVSEAEARQASGTAYLLSPAASTTAADEVACGIVYSRQTSISTTWDSGFTNVNTKNSSAKSVDAARKVLTAAGAVSTTHTLAASSVAMGGMATFKKQGAGTTTSPVGGSVLFAGGQPSIKSALATAPSKGVVRLIGGQPAISLSTNVTALPQAGSMKWAGGQPAVNTALVVTPIAGKIAMVGGQPVIVTPDTWASPVQTNLSASGSGTSPTRSFATQPVAGNLITCKVVSGSTGINPPAGWTTLVSGVNTTEGTAWALFGKIAGAGESSTVTASTDTSDEWAITIQEFTGPFAALPAGIDLSEAEARQAAAATYLCSPANSTAQADELALTVVYSEQTTISSTWDSGFTSDGAEQSTTKSVGGAYKILSAAGTVSTTQTLGASAVAMGGMATLKQAISGVITPAPGSMLWAGGQPVVKTAVVSQPIAGSLLWSGGQPSVSIATGATARPAMGVVTWVGGRPAITTQYAVKPYAGRLSFSGAIPTIVVDRVTVVPGTGKVIFSGRQPTVIARNPGWTKVAAASTAWTKQ